MSTAPTARPVRLEATAPSAFLLRGAAVGAAVATAINAALWAGGRVADTSFVVSPPLGDATFQVGIVMVVLATLGAFAAGSGLLALASRRSRRSARAVVGAAVLVAVASVGGPLAAAPDGAASLLLAAMHLATGAVFVVTARVVLR